MNPQIVDAGADGAINLPPSFITLSGPVREARFVFFTDGSGNPITSQPKGLPAPCKINPTPEDHTNFHTTAVGTPSAAVQFAMFMRLLAPPERSEDMPGGGESIKNGGDLFATIGCATCHKESFVTLPSRITSDLGSAPVRLFSDLEVHHMGTGLADNVAQGTAGGDQFRTAPLWGLGKRIFFLHDGRTSNPLTAISAHFSTGSEANIAKVNFDALIPSQRQDILNFLRSL